MSFMLKRVWVTPAHSGELHTLSLESARPDADSTRLRINEDTFPHAPTPLHPMRHVAVLSCLDLEDLVAISTAIQEYLFSK